MVFYLDNALQPHIRRHTDFFIVNLPAFDVELGLSQPVRTLDLRLFEMTNFFAHFSFALPVGDCRFAVSVDEALSNSTKDFCLIQNCGHIFYGYDPLSRDMKDALERCEFMMGDVLDRGGYFHMREGSILINRRAWEQAGKPSYGLPMAGQKTLAVPKAEGDALLSAGGEAAVEGRFGYGWNAISAALSAGHKVMQWPVSLRKWMHFCDAYRGDKTVWERALTDITAAPTSTDTALNATKEFFRNIPDRADAPKRIFVLNSEPDGDIPNLRFAGGLDRAFVLASGFKANRILDALNFNERTEVVVYDYSAPAVELKRIMVADWDGRDFPDFFKKARPQLEATFGKLVYIPTQFLSDDKSEQLDQEFRREMGTRFETEAQWLAHWTRYRKLKHTFVHIDVIVDADATRALLETHARGNCVMWISDMFNSPNAVGKLHWTKREAAYANIRDGLRKNAESTLIIGGAPHSWFW